MDPAVSVIVCTFNRARSIKSTIRSLLAQALSDSYEIIVVDNGPTNDTFSVVKGFQQKARTPLLYVHETEQGLSRARNRGLRSARGDIVAFIDDDARADPAWLATLTATFRSSENVAAVGGRIKPARLEKLPSWLPRRLISHLSLLDYGKDVINLRYPNYPFGTNMAFRRSVFEEVGLFDPSLGRSGTTSFQTGEETDLFSRIELAGKSVYYNPSAVVYHIIHPQRLRPVWFYHQTYWIGFSSGVIEKRYKPAIYVKLNVLLSAVIIGAGCSCWGLTRLLNHQVLDVFARCAIHNRCGYIRGVLDEWLQDHSARRVTEPRRPARQQILCRIADPNKINRGHKMN
ncbi:MAG: glycosyltransferase [Deltaproteobacteria bacterium]|nr:glycosyltransferase [Deltaproteobacteria bacterium]